METKGISPEKTFKIEEDDFLTETPKEDIISSENSNSEEKDIKGGFSVESMSSLFKDKGIEVSNENIQNYYNQITENKNYVNEYNQTINELEETKNILQQKIEEGKIDGSELKEINQKLSNFDEKLAELNVEKQQKEDSIKETINNIFNDNSSDNNQDVNFETKNTLLNMVLNDDVTQPENKEEREFLGETPKEPENKEESEFLGETPKEPENNVEGLMKEDLTESNSNDFGKKDENNGDKMGDSLKNLSETMKKGFDAVLSAIKEGGDKKKEFSEQPEQVKEEQKNAVAGQNHQEKDKIKQKNYIEDYRDSLRSNAPIKGFVGIKGMELKANNIGSYI